MMNRRKLFSFLSVSPIAALGAIAQTKMPASAAFDSVTIGTVTLKPIEKGIGMYGPKGTPFGSGDRAGFTFTWDPKPMGLEVDIRVLSDIERGWNNHEAIGDAPGNRIIHDNGSDENGGA